MTWSTPTNGENEVVEILFTDAPVLMLTIAPVLMLTMPIVKHLIGVCCDVKHLIGVCCDPESISFPQSNRDERQTKRSLLYLTKRIIM